MGDTISRQALLEEYDRLHAGEPGRARKMIEDAPSAQPEIIRCKDCKYFELDHFEKVGGVPIPIIVAHEICMKWGEGCKSSIGGWCFMAERRIND